MVWPRREGGVPGRVGRLGERKRVLRGMLRAEYAGQSWEREAGRGTREQGKGQVQRGCHLGRAPW